MRHEKALLAAMFFFIAVGRPFAQSAASPAEIVTKDPTAMKLLTSAIAAAGGLSAASSVQDYTATGTVVYHWAGKDVQGDATVRGRGLSQLRFDATLPDGIRSWAINGGKGTLSEPDGTRSVISYHSAKALEGMIYPLARIIAGLADPTISISDKGIVGLGSQQLRQIHFHEVLANKTLERLGDADYFIDPSTLLIVGLHDNTHPANDLLRDIPHGVYFSDFRTVQGLTIAFSISETVDTQTIWSVHFQSLAFNSGLPDATFEF